MKKTLRTILAGAVALLAVSCYDDSGLQDGLGKLGDELNEFKESLIDASQLGLSRTDFYLRYTASKTIQLTAENIAEYYVMAKPDGWKASFEGTALTVTAPTKEAYKIGAAELKGQVLIHATSEKGECKVVELSVEAGEGLIVDVAADGKVTIKNAYTSIQTDEEGAEVFGFTNFCIGICPAAEYYGFEANYQMGTFEEVWNKYGGPMAGASCFYYNNNKAGAYVEGEYELDVISTDMNTLYSTDMGNYENLPSGAYVVFYASMNDKGLPADGVFTVDYLNVSHEVAVASVNHNSATVSVAVSGADSYLVGGVAASMYQFMTSSFDEYMNSSSMMAMGPWYAFVNFGGIMQMGNEMTAADLPSVMNVSDLANWGDPLSAGETYYVWVMPMFNHLKTVDMDNSYPEENYYAYKYNYDYNKHFKPYVLEVKTNELQAGATAPTLAEGTQGLYEVSASITLAENTEKVYYAFYTADAWAGFAEDQNAIRNDLYENCYYPLTETGAVTYDSNVTPETTYVLAAVAISKDGKYSEVATLSVATEAITRDSNISVSLASLTLEDGTYTAVLNVTGATNVAGYNLTNNADSYASDVVTAEKNVITKTGSAYGYQWGTVENGTVTLTFAENSYKKDYFVWGYNVVDEAVVLASAPLVFNLAENLPKAE